MKTLYWFVLLFLGSARWVPVWAQTDPYTVITGAIDWPTLEGDVATALIALVGALIVVRGAKWLFRMVGR